MPSSHPPSLVSHAKRVLLDHNLRGTSVLVALSGGPDSMALVHVLSLLAPRLQLRLASHAVDHGLRPEAADEIAVAKDYCRSLDVPFTSTRVVLKAGGNLQARAREARHTALREAAELMQCAWIATAHHAHDRAETLLMRIVRGTSIHGLGVMGALDAPLIRPFIRAPKEAILAHLRRHEIPFCVDPSNENRRFLRARIRFDVLPKLEELNPQVVLALCALADDAIALPKSLPRSREARKLQAREILRSKTNKVEAPPLVSGAHRTNDARNDNALRAQLFQSPEPGTLKQAEAKEAGAQAPARGKS